MVGKPSTTFSDGNFGMRRQPPAIPKSQAATRCPAKPDMQRAGPTIRRLTGSISGFKIRGAPHFNKASIASMTDLPYWPSGASMSKCPAPSSFRMVTESPLAVADAS